MISLISSHCIGCIISVKTNQLYQFISLFPCKRHLVYTIEHLINKATFPPCLLDVFHKECLTHGVLKLVLLLYFPGNYASWVNTAPLCEPLKCLITLYAHTHTHLWVSGEWQNTTFPKLASLIFTMVLSILHLVTSFLM